MPVNVLDRDKCSVIVVDEPREPVRNSARPLNRVVAKDIAPVNALNSETCFARIRVEASDPVSDLAKPFVS